MTELNGDFVVCLRNDGAEDLEIRKIYQVIWDEAAQAKLFLRIVDDSGDDFLYPAKFFMPILVPQSTADALRRRAAAG
jgi:hypothetical protein